MPNSLEQFYSYLADLLFQFFENGNQLKAGEKYYSYFEKSTDIELFYNKLIQARPELVEDFSYRHKEDQDAFNSKVLVFDQVRLILATPMQTTEYFTTTLRNQVSSQLENFSGKALLSFFSGHLDSLTGGTGDLAKAGMPFSIEYFYKDILDNIKRTQGFSSADKIILMEALDRKRKEFRIEGLSIFDFAPIISIVRNGVFHPQDYSALGLFPHQELDSISDKSKIHLLMEANRETFESIELSINYGNPLKDLGRKFTGAGISKVEKGINDGSWKLIDFADIMKLRLKKDKGEPVIFEGAKVIPEKHVVTWGDGKIEGKRVRNLIIFNPLNKYPLSVKLQFDSTLKGIMKVERQAETATVNKVGKTIHILLTEPAFNKDTIIIDYQDAKAKNVRYHFRLWCLPISDEVLTDIKTDYLLTDEGELLIEKEGGVTFNSVFTHIQHEQITGGETINLPYNLALKLSVPSQEEDDDPVRFSLQVGETEFSMVLKPQSKSENVANGWNVWQDKRVLARSFEYFHNPDNDTFKLRLDTGESVPREEFRANLLLEVQMMESPALAWWLTENNKLIPRTLRLSKSLVTAYRDYHEYIHEEKTLPSLFYMDQKGLELANIYVLEFIKELAKLKEGEKLQDETSADLVLIGTIAENFKNEVVRFSPLHPLMVAYQQELNTRLGKNTLYEAMLKKLTPLNHVPYLKWKNNSSTKDLALYTSKENSHSPEWLYFSDDLHFKQFAGRGFVRSLVGEKIQEFTSSFPFLFAFDYRSPIKINVFNMGDCLQVLQGIFDYYKDRALSGVNIQELRPIELYIHGSEKYVTSFEKMSHLLDQEDIEKSFDITTSSKRIDAEDLINAFRANVKYYALTGKVGDEHYAHLTFYQFDNDHAEITFRETQKIPSGLSLEGLISDVPSYHDDHTYVTGFGSDYIGGDNALISVTRGYNALAKVSFTKDPFERGKVICTNIVSDIKPKLDYLYDHSQWVTFVDPKFDLSFFKDVSNLIIVHCSDQYSNASGFDAITVSRKSKQYESLLKDILQDRSVIHQQQDIYELINLYNAINGQWLLKLISSKKQDTVRREKLSIPSAVKAFLAFYDHPEIIWIPVSLEEILRISGGAGLSKKEGLFSTKNLGAKNEHSDDLLMIGLYQLEGELHLELHPLEVKIGQVDSSIRKKAKLQAQRTRKLIYDHLDNPQRPFEAAFYQNFFAKLAIINSSKMELYDVWPGQLWDKVTSDYRVQLLNNQFKISSHLSGAIGRYTVAEFSQGAMTRLIEPDEDRGMLLTLLEDDGYEYLTKKVDFIKYWIHNTSNSIQKDQLLGVRYLNLLDIPEPEDDPDPENLPEDELEDNGELEEGSELNLEEEVASEQENQEPEPANKLQVIFQPASGPMQIHLGTDINSNKSVLWYPTDTNKVMHTNTGIIGTMGTGKTQFTKSLITQLSRQGNNNLDAAPIGILIFDYKGDYINPEFVEATCAKVHKLFHLPYNPLAIDIGKNAMPLLPLHIASTLQETISNAFGLGNKQKAFLKEVIMNAYERKGIYKGDETTWNKIAPTISDICEIYLDDEKMAIDSLHAALKQLYDFEIFQPDGTKTKSLFELIDGVTVINLSGYSPDIQNLVVAITLDAFYSQMQKTGHSKISGNFRQLTKMVLVDEADNFLSKNFSSLRKILKEGREFGVGTILSTQFLNHFSTSDNEYDQYILTWIIHRVNDVKVKDVDSLFSITEKDQKEKLIQIIKKLEKHHSVVNLAGSKPILIEDMPFWKLINRN